jgi:hypothetical protein
MSRHRPALHRWLDFIGVSRRQVDLLHASCVRLMEDFDRFLDDAKGCLLHPGFSSSVCKAVPALAFWNQRGAVAQSNSAGYMAICRTLLRQCEFEFCQRYAVFPPRISTVRPVARRLRRRFSKSGSMCCELWPANLFHYSF